MSLLHHFYEAYISVASTKRGFDPIVNYLEMERKANGLSVLKKGLCSKKINKGFFFHNRMYNNCN